MKLIVLLLLSLSAFAQERAERYAVVLSESPDSGTGNGKVMAAQQRFRSALSSRNVREIGSIQTLANAIFVQATPEVARELATMPGVRYVQRMRAYKRLDERAAQLMNAPAAWSALGGVQNAGNGMKIGILDSGIDHTHPALQDPGLAMPGGFPRCSGAECDYTSSKVIAARSFVDLLAYGFEGDTRPDDLSPRDRVGHGTAMAMLAAGRAMQGPAASVTGIAPKAYLGNYKVFGSPGINDYTYDDAVLRALEAAFNDGMDVVSLSLGAPAVWGPDDRGTICGGTGQNACDLQVEAIENAIRKGMMVVLSSGNSGDTGQEIPTLTSVESPGTAPSAITVGATTNARILFNTVRVVNGPGNLTAINARFGNGLRPAAPLTAPVKDVSSLGDDGRACQPLGTGSLNGTIALIVRGGCTFLTKLLHAQNAGAVGVLIYQASGNALFPPSGLEGTGIPLVLIGNSPGTALKQFLQSNPNTQVTLDPGLRSVEATPDEVAVFSSQGPAIGEPVIKPEVVAVGTDIYVATQNYDPNGEMYDASRYIAVEGTSFSAPMVAGAVALVKQRQPGLSPGWLKSAVVNTAKSSGIIDYDYQGNQINARAVAMGAGKLDVLNAIDATVLAQPSTLSFGVLTNSSTFPVTRVLRFRNTGNSAAEVRVNVQQRDSDAAARVTVTPSQLTVNPGQEGSVTVRLEGGPPRAGMYEGILRVEGGRVPLRIPYLYIVGDNIPFNAFPLNGDGFTRPQDWDLRVAAKFVDRFGSPVSQLRVRFRVDTGGGTIKEATETTDALGIAEAIVTTGSVLGEQRFSVEPANGTSPRVEFIGNVIQLPSLRSGGVVNAGSGEADRPLAPGSYISLFGASFTESTRVFGTNYLPISLARLSVGFDVVGQTRQSYPGRISFASPTQINVQIPWELQGQSEVKMKVSNGDYSSAIITIPLSEVSPAFFEYRDAGSGRQLIAALDQNNALVTAANGVRPNTVVQLFANGLGPVDNQPGSGEPASTTQLAHTRSTPQVTIGGQQAPVTFSGLAPGFVGLYQVNVTVPAGVPAGIQPVVLTINGTASKAASLAIQ